MVRPRAHGSPSYSSLRASSLTSEFALDSTCKVAQRTPVLYGCVSASSFRNPLTVDIPRRNKLELERDASKAPAPAVVDPHHSSSQEEATTCNIAAPMKKLKREPDDTNEALTPPPNICVDEERYALRPLQGIETGFGFHLRPCRALSATKLVPEKMLILRVLSID
ncbi:hypothetical protein KIN20_003039 [Parelaphostrongylus tenuis]|uniref:Uncharacterized protein n=1 Tax=Parelaphostrongylus tenuis TaxID=148309 RepID=A0AAD5LZI1_PARTN|nr:hypothetical protein KIN20_003039 [Parelaphostrongylus tenuis]